MPNKDQEYLKTLPFQPGMLIAEKYKVERLVAAGGMGAVIEAHHEVLDQTVAIKLMRPEIAENVEAAQRFLREARAAARIESDFVARVTDVDMWNDTPFMVMEFLKGDDLDDVIASDATLTVSDAVDYVMQGLAGLHAAHALGVVHRDLKPSNLFLVQRANGRKRVRILDFGISKVVGEDSEGLKAGATTSTEAMLGTPRYMSPEQVSSAKEVDERTDLWAMGLILYELLTKTYPFEGDTAGAILAAILTSPVPSAREIRREIPEELDAVIMRLLRKRRNERYPSAKAVMKALAPFASRRIQALLLEPEELEGAMADTETQGTPSEVLSSARTEALLKAEDIGLAATAISNAEFAGDTEKSTMRSSPGSSTETSMSLAGIDKKGNVARMAMLGLLAVGIAGATIYFMRGTPEPASAVAAPTSEPVGTGTTEPTTEPSAPPAANDLPPPSEPSADAAAPSASASVPKAPVTRPPLPGTRRPPNPPTTQPQPSKKPKDLLNDWD